MATSSDEKQRPENVMAEGLFMSEEWVYELLGMRSITIGVGDKNSSVIRSKESLPC